MWVFFSFFFLLHFNTSKIRTCLTNNVCISCLQFYLPRPSLKTLEDICSLHMITLNQGNTIYQVLTIFYLFLLGNYIWPDMSQKNVLIHSNALYFN